VNRAVFRAWVALIFAWQVFAHGFWLPISTHSGQTTIPWLMNQGRVLFGDVLEQHAPGSSLLAALAQRLLPSVALDDLVRGLDVLLALALGALIVRAALHLGGRMAAAWALAWWALWLPVFGNVMFYFNTLLALAALAAYSLGQGRWASMSAARALGVGLLMGLATLFKQQAWLGVILLGLVWAWQGAGWRRLAAYGLGALVVPGLIVLVVALQGNLESYLYWNWTFNLSGQMESIFPGVDFARKLGLACILLLPFMLQTAQAEAGPARADRLALLALLLSGLALIVPRAGEIQVTAGLPFLAIASGLALAQALPRLRLWPIAQMDALPLGLLGGLALLSLWSGLVAYVPSPLGLGATLGYDEFWPVVEALRPHQQAGDTLFVLPEADSTPQLHPMTDMLPPGTWIKGWTWYLEQTGMAERLLAEWESQPPTFVVVFPALYGGSRPGIDPLLAFTEARYDEIARTDVYLHGEAIVYRLRG
jgi:hypothetical protein